MLLCSLVAWISPSALRYSPRKQFPSAFWQGRQRLFKVFRLVWWMCVHPLLWLLLVSTFTNETQVSWPDPLTMWLRNSSPSLWYRSKKSKPKPFSAFCAHLWAFSESTLRETCDRWFTRQWVTWRYLAGASSPSLLHSLPKINGGYFPKSLRIIDYVPPYFNLYW
jgi:hypothetical protein